MFPDQLCNSSGDWHGVRATFLRAGSRATASRARRHAVECHPERSEGSDAPGTEILRCAQDDRPGWQEATETVALLSLASRTHWHVIA